MRKQVDLSRFDNSTSFHPGAGVVKRMLWYFMNALFFINPAFPFRSPKPFLLRLFGAKVGKGVVIHPGVNIKFPWRLSIGDHSWIGQRVWLDNLDQLTIGNNVVISQGALIIQGSHDYKRIDYPTYSKPVVLEDGSWIGAGAIVTLGITVRSHAVLAVGSVATKDLEAYTIYQGNPALPVRERVVL
ncbi:MAG: colanic acid biosynthesis acetyltransferase WcaF [Flavobacteriales bacterium]|jgi:putative colanic acid biosynthesis acetyltransferase WcaF|nr:colanic acid biosynthesis acetyltransferase WcaF [Flavobacteriales bacterium]MBK6883199.1 colanic acid biosynthesis acetyltransferase WcaF [Flavobacteriales bacterium]MBK7103238.1 colanic acid biosynthesis acetyltransferase WcaF [Flavobacteriales bacterium]MBK7112790.1 colanic acid biosynthesis acetyltransferase WcaF [Flavobacteriales bacterium]MBK7620174.1 colanic acid biosynthesis acetyltransferase WcaF [Flavobacteriales bacterium]